MVLDSLGMPELDKLRALNDSIPPQDFNDGMDLLDASPLTVSQDGHFNWGLPAVIGTLLKRRQADIPTNRQDWGRIIHPDDRRDYEQAVESLKWAYARYEVRYRIQSSHQNWIHVEEIAERLPESDSDFETATLDSEISDPEISNTEILNTETSDGDQEQTGFQVRAVIRNISAEVEAAKDQAWLLRHDSITGLANTKTFTETSNILVGLARRIKGKGIFYRLRLNNLDNIHHVYGHAAEAQILKSVTERMKEIIRVPDCLGKEGRADFLLAVVGISGLDSDPGILASRLKVALSNRPYVTPFGRIKADFTISYSTFPQGLADSELILQQTLLAMEAEPNEDIIGYNETMAAPAVKTDTSITEADIRQALSEQRITLAYQPIVTAATGALHHYECLLRLRREDGSMESAWRLILAAEKLGLVQHLDQRALDIATQALDENPNLKLALNVSAETIKSDENAKDYLKSLEFLGDRTSQIILELTETATLNDPAMAGAFSSAARHLGCEFAIDDFGSGHTSFQNLLAIEAETIKIDGSLIKGISKSPHMQNFVRMMVDLAQTFSVKTVAEMVETRADAVLLRRLGVDYLQGYLFGMPNETPHFLHTDFLK